jgi:amino acid transporter/nucleotide-binding universal stress UspA family protein
MSNVSSGSPSSPATSGSLHQQLIRGAGVIIVSSVMFSFISFWRTAAVVLCDLASTAYYIGGIVEQMIGPAAPWFILCVLLLAFAVGLVYIESCSLFVRGGVYRVVRAALGSTAAKLAVSALIFDYILTGPISTVSAGQYVMGLLLDTIKELQLGTVSETLRDDIKTGGAVILACAVTLYFYRQNIRGMHESSDKALKIMQATAVMGIIMIVWCFITLMLRPSDQINPVPLAPDLHKKFELDPKTGQNTDRPKIDPATGKQVDPLGFLPHLLPESWIEAIRSPISWLHLLGIVGLLIAFGHSVLAMSGLETLAQVYREVESPKLLNFKRAAFIVFTFALVLTGTISFMAVMLIPNSARMTEYSDNLIGGLAMNMAGPRIACLVLNAFVTIVGFLLLSGACNTSIIGANGVLNRVAEDGILPDWLRSPHPRYGTTHRVLTLIVGLQLFTIVASRGNTLVLGEAYAFGVVWSFVFQAFAMVVLRFKDPRPREFRVPLNIPVGKIDIPVGLGLILLVLLSAAVLNFLTKEVATAGGLVFTALFFSLFTLTERFAIRHRGGVEHHEHVELFNQETATQITSEGLGLNAPYRKLISIRSTQNLFMLEKALAETDPETTVMVVMTAKYIPPGDEGPVSPLSDLDAYDQQLMTKVVELAEKAGKQVKPLIVPTNNPLHAILKTARDIQANELILGASNKYTADEQLEQIAFYWISLHDGKPMPLTVRILSRERDMYLDLAGGSRIPKISERRARSVDELRAAGVGVDRVLLLHDGTRASSDLFQSVLTMLDDKVVLGLAPLLPQESLPANQVLEQDSQRAEQLDRPILFHKLAKADGEEIVELARKELYDLIILLLPAESPVNPLGKLDARATYIIQKAHCRVLLASTPVIPDEVVDSTPSARP